MENQVQTQEKYLSTKNSFLPKGYQVPDKSKQFMKLSPGDNVVRVLSSPMLGFVVFTEENKPVRKRFEDGDFSKKELSDLKAKKGDDGNYEGSRHFWIMLVWDKQENAPKILEVTQISILKPLFVFTQDKEWGDLRKFDINIQRVGTGKTDTEFTVIPKPHRALSKTITKALEELSKNNLLDLEAIWDGSYPFEFYNY